MGQPVKTVATKAPTKMLGVAATSYGSGAVKKKKGPTPLKDHKLGKAMGLKPPDKKKKKMSPNDYKSAASAYGSSGLKKLRALAGKKIDKNWYAHGKVWTLNWKKFHLPYPQLPKPKPFAKGNGPADDAEDLVKNAKKNSVGCDRVKGCHEKNPCKDNDPKKYCSYYKHLGSCNEPWLRTMCRKACNHCPKHVARVSDQAYLGPKGHYYIGPNRRRIGAGFGRRRGPADKASRTRPWIARRRYPRRKVKISAKMKAKEKRGKHLRGYDKGYVTKMVKGPKGHVHFKTTVYYKKKGAIFSPCEPWPYCAANKVKKVATPSIIHPGYARSGASLTKGFTGMTHSIVRKVGKLQRAWYTHIPSKKVLKLPKPHLSFSHSFSASKRVKKSCTIERSYDYLGGDLKRVQNVASAEVCGGLCGKYKACKSWTYGKKAGQVYTKTCFFKKSAKPGRRKSSCCDSGLPCVPAVKKSSKKSKKTKKKATKKKLALSKLAIKLKTAQAAANKAAAYAKSVAAKRRKAIKKLAKKERNSKLKTKLSAEKKKAAREAAATKKVAEKNAKRVHKAKALLKEASGKVAKRAAAKKANANKKKESLAKAKKAHQKAIEKVGKAQKQHAEAKQAHAKMEAAAKKAKVKKVTKEKMKKKEARLKRADEATTKLKVKLHNARQAVERRGKAAKKAKTAYAKYGRRRRSSRRRRHRRRRSGSRRRRHRLPWLPGTRRRRRRGRL